MAREKKSEVPAPAVIPSGINRKVYCVKCNAGFSTSDDKQKLCPLCDKKK